MTQRGTRSISRSASSCTEAAARLTDNARDADCTDDEYLAAILDCYVAARHGAGAGDESLHFAGHAGVVSIPTADHREQPEALAVRAPFLPAAPSSLHKSSDRGCRQPSVMA